MDNDNMNVLRVPGGLFGNARYFKKDRVKIIGQNLNTGSLATSDEFEFETDSGEILIGYSDNPLNARSCGGNF